MEERRRLMDEERKKRRMFQDIGRKMMGVFLIQEKVCGCLFCCEKMLIITDCYRGPSGKGETRTERENGAREQWE